MFLKAYKFRIYPNKTQRGLLNSTFGAVRYAWNQWVENFNKPVETDKEFKTPKQFKATLEWMTKISSAAIQQKEQDFKEFKNQFFSKKRKLKIGRPSFKNKRNRQSYRLPNQKFYIANNKIRLEKVGFVTVVFDRVIPADVKYVNCTVSKDLAGSFFISILVEQEIKQLSKTGKGIGIDVGLKSFAVLSDERVIDNPRFFRENQSGLTRIQQHLSRKIRGSKHYVQSKRQAAKFQRKTTRQRTHFIHNVSSFIVANFDVIAIEDLNIRGMVRNHCLGKSIADAAWSEFFRQLDYKCKWYGKELRRVGRFEPTSKTCNVCGFYYKDLTLGVREWACPCCGTAHDRDVNASKNILKQSGRVEPELQTWRERQTFGMQTEAVPCEVSRVS